MMEALVRDFARAEAVLAAETGAVQDSDATDGAERGPVLSLRLAPSGGDPGAAGRRVDYFRRDGGIERVVRPSDAGPVRRHVLSPSVESFRVEQRGALVHVEFTCAHTPGLQRFASTLATDFFCGGSAGGYASARREAGTP